MICLEQPVLMRSELFQLCLEELVFLVCDCLLVENKNIGDIVIVNLLMLLNDVHYSKNNYPD